MRVNSRSTYLMVVQTFAYSTTAHNQLKKCHTIGRFIQPTDYNKNITQEFPPMTTATLTKDQLIELKKEFVEFKLNEMSFAELQDHVRSMMLLDIDPDPEILKDTIDEYDDFLYDILVSYVKDEENSYEILQEYIHERHENDWVND